MAIETKENRYMGDFETLKKGVYCGLLYDCPSEEIPKLMDAIIDLDKSKNGAYKERDMLLSLITKLLPSWLERHPDSDTNWEDDWRWIVFVTLPTGQASWHIHDSELSWFDHLGRRAWQAMNAEPSWDGHTTEEKYERVLAVNNDSSHPIPS